MKKMLKRKYMSRLLIIAGILLLMLAWVAFSGSGQDSKGVTVYRIAKDPTWNPIDFMGKEREIGAFTDELIRSIADEQGMRVTFAVTGANALLGGLNSDQFDVILTGVSPTPTTESVFVYSEPFYRYGPVLVVSEKSGYTRPEELNGRILGVERGSTTVFNLAINPKTTLVAYDNILDAMEALSRGDLDGVILNLLPAYLYTQSLYAGTSRVISSPYTNDGLRMVARRSQPGVQLVDAFNKGLAAMKADGRYEALLKRWGLPDPDISPTSKETP